MAAIVDKNPKYKQTSKIAILHRINMEDNVVILAEAEMLFEQSKFKINANFSLNIANVRIIAVSKYLSVGILIFDNAVSCRSFL
jgi:hypothetical protein